jgi:hypothetical protein
MPTHILKSLLMMGIVSLAACADSTSPQPDDGVGRVEFSYTSANSPVSGSFTAEGARPADTETGTWAAAATDQADAMVVARRQSGGVHDQAIIFIPGGTTGTSAIVPDCDDSCAAITVVVHQSIGGTVREYQCVVNQGTVSVSTLTSGRIKGTFSGTGACQSPADPNQPALSIAQGTFDAPFVSPQ